MSHPEQARRSRRFGIAVELPEPYGSTLAQARARTGDPAALEMPPHITLVAPVQVTGPVERVYEVLQEAGKRVGPFDVHLRGTGTFRPLSDVVFVAVAAGITELERLAAGLRVPPLNPPMKFPYHPHVTVAHDIAPEGLDAVYEELVDFQAWFPVSSIRLYEKDPVAVPLAPDGRRWYPVADVALR